MPTKPANYGVWWNTNKLDERWYKQIHEPRGLVHAAFLDWVARTEQSDGPFASVLEVGCGRGVVYPEVFSRRGCTYTGHDVSEKEIAWCQEHKVLPGVSFVSGDFITDLTLGRFDLVFAHAVIDHVYDADAFLARMVRAATRWVYVTAYKSWNPQLQAHRYAWDEKSTCFYNDLSPDRLREQLARLGCSDVRVEAFTADAQPVLRETLIVARTH